MTTIERNGRLQESPFRETPWDNKLNAILDDLQDSISRKKDTSYLNGPSSTRHYREYRTTSTTRASSEMNSGEDPSTIDLFNYPQQRPGSQTKTTTVYRIDKSSSNGPRDVDGLETQIQYLKPANTATVVYERQASPLPGETVAYSSSQRVIKQERKVQTCQTSSHQYPSVTSSDFPPIMAPGSPSKYETFPRTEEPSHYAHPPPLHPAVDIEVPSNARLRQNISELDSLLNDLNNAKQPKCSQETPVKGPHGLTSDVSPAPSSQKSGIDPGLHEVPSKGLSVLPSEPLGHSTPQKNAQVTTTTRTYHYTHSGSREPGTDPGYPSVSHPAPYHGEPDVNQPDTHVTKTVKTYTYNYPSQQDQQGQPPHKLEGALPFPVGKSDSDPVPVIEKPQYPGDPTIYRYYYYTDHPYSGKPGQPALPGDPENSSTVIRPYSSGYPVDIPRSLSPSSPPRSPTSPTGPIIYEYHIYTTHHYPGEPGSSPQDSSPYGPYGKPPHDSSPVKLKPLNETPDRPDISPTHMPYDPEHPDPKIIYRYHTTHHYPQEPPMYPYGPSDPKSPHDMPSKKPSDGSGVPPGEPGSGPDPIIYHYHTTYNYPRGPDKPVSYPPQSASPQDPSPIKPSRDLPEDSQPPNKAPPITIYRYNTTHLYPGDPGGPTDDHPISPPQRSPIEPEPKTKSEPPLPNGGPPLGDHPDRPGLGPTVITYHTTTHHHFPNEPSPIREPVKPHVITPQKTPIPSKPPKKLDDLMATFYDPEPDTLGKPETPPPFGALAYRSQPPKKPEPKVNGMVDMQDAPKPAKPKVEERPKTKNIAGPGIYYPPGVDMFSKKDEPIHAELKPDGNASADKDKGKSSGKGKGDGGGAAVVPVCLPLCCAMPCVIL